MKPVNPKQLCGVFVAFALLVLVQLAHAADADKPVKVFILAGQSNMEGKAKVQLLDYQSKQPATADLFKHLHRDGKWI